MIQELNINGDTTYKSDPIDDATTQIKIQAASLLPNTLEADLNLLPVHFHANNLRVNSGDLAFELKNTLKNISFELNRKGELIVNAPDADNYSIDENGYLIYTYR